MQLCRHTQLRPFYILSPRWHDRKVLLAKYKVGEHNKIYFTGKDGESMGKEPYYVSGKIVKKAKKESNGIIDCYAVALDKLQPLEMEEHCQHEY